MKFKHLKNITAIALAAAFAVMYANYTLDISALSVAGIAVMLAGAVAVLVEKK